MRSKLIDIFMTKHGDFKQVIALMEAKDYETPGTPEKYFYIRASSPDDLDLTHDYYRFKGVGEGEDNYVDEHSAIQYAEVRAKGFVTNMEHYAFDFFEFLKERSEAIDCYLWKQERWYRQQKGYEADL